jgi:nucleoside-diphosphate-sugar epimerase
MFTGMLLTENKIFMKSNGMSWRPHVYIEDALEAFRCMIEWKNESGVLEIFNVGNEQNNMTIIETAKLVSSLFPASSIEYLDNSEDNSIFSDSKIVNERDARDYRVNFNRIYNEVSDFKRKTSLLEGVEEMISKLNRLGLTTDIFRSPEFYRLPYLELSQQRKNLSDF